MISITGKFANDSKLTITFYGLGHLLRRSICD